MDFPYAPWAAVATDLPCSCFGREHGRNKGEFKSLESRPGYSLPTSLTLRRALDHAVVSASGGPTDRYGGPTVPATHPSRLGHRQGRRRPAMDPAATAATGCADRSMDPMAAS